MNRRKPDDKFIVTTFKNNVFAQKIVTFNELQKVKKESMRLYVNEETGEVSYQPTEGDRKSLNNGDPGLGFYEWLLLIDTMWVLDGWHELTQANFMNARVCRLRAEFGDSGYEQWMFETRKKPKYSIRLNPKISWMFIEKKAEAPE
jgi:hypothetical protein